MQTKTCPECGDDIYVAAKTHKCGWREDGSKKPTEPSRWAILAAEARAKSYAEGPTSFDLTDQQWYNVCKFWPWVALHCRRPRFVVGPNHPLDATARQGPMMRHRTHLDLPVTQVSEREAIQTESV